MSSTVSHAAGSVCVYLRLFHIIVDRPQQVTDSDNKNIDVITVIIKNEKNRQPSLVP